MPEYQARTATVTAMQYDGMGNFRNSRGQLYDWIWQALEDGTIVPQNHLVEERIPFLLKTPFGEYLVRDGDWLVRSSTGELFACGDLLFTVLYEETF